MSKTSTVKTSAPNSVADNTGQADWRALPVLLAGVFLIVLDFFIVNVALPAMQSDLHAGPGTIEWVVAGYGLTFAAFLITAGRVGDAIGRRRMYLFGVAVFILASLLCVAAISPAMLVVARFLQGAGAAMISPQVLSIIGVLYRGRDRVRAISVYGIVMGVAAAAGQLVGGVLIQADVAGLGWRAIFAINVPVGLAILICSVALIPETRAPRVQRPDVVGMVLMTATVTALVLPLIEGRQAGWPLWTWMLLALVPVLVAATVWQQRGLAQRGGDPLFPRALLTVPTFRSGLAVQLVFWLGQASCYMLLALYLQEGRGLSPFASGAMFLILAAAYLVTSLRAPALTVRFGRRVIAVGAMAIALGYLALLAALAAGPGAPLWLLAPGLALAGAGQGLCITPLTSVVLAHAEPSQAGAVSGALSTAQQVGNCLGVALLGLMFFGLAGQGVPTAFAVSTIVLGFVAAAVLVLTRLLPPPSRAAVE